MMTPVSTVADYSTVKADEYEEGVASPSKLDGGHDHSMASPGAGGVGVTTGGASTWEPLDDDIIGGRGAKVNGRPGNKRFRALCFARKAEFDAGNHAAKRRIAMEIVTTVTQQHNARFLKRVMIDNNNNNNDDIRRIEWEEMSTEQAIQKACQVMRDYKRPDRLGAKDDFGNNNNHNSNNSKQRIPIVVPNVTHGDMTMAMASAGAHHHQSPSSLVQVENPFGVTANDILSGRGAFVNGHVGNQRLRKLAMERKEAFDSGNFTEKQALAAEIVAEIRATGGRFLKRKTVDKNNPLGNAAAANAAPEDMQWEELSEEKAIHKACQVMRDINRPDRLDRNNPKRARSGPRMFPDPSETPPPLPALLQQHHQQHQQQNIMMGATEAASTTATTTIKENINNNDSNNSNMEHAVQGSLEDKSTVVGETAMDDSVRQLSAYV